MPAFRFHQEYRRILVYGRITGLSIPWQGEEKYPKLMFCYQILMVIFYIHRMECAIYAFVSVTKFEMKIYLLGVVFFYMGTIFLLLFYFYRGRSFKSLIEALDGLSERFTDSGLGEEDYFQKEYQKDTGQVNSLARFIPFVCFTTSFVYCMSVPVMDLFSGHYRQRVAVPVAGPIDLFIYNLPGGFEIMVIQQSMTYTLTGFHNYVSEYIMLALFKIQKTYFNYLGLVLKNIGEEMVYNESNALDRFHKWLNLHKDSINIFNEVMLVFSPMIVMYFVVTVVMVAGCLLFMFDQSSSNILQTIFGGAYMLLQLAQLYLLCHTADNIDVEAKRISLQAYSIPWTILDSKIKGSLVLVITMANRPMLASAYRIPSFTFNKSSYKELFVNTLSAYMGFIKLSELAHGQDQENH